MANHVHVILKQQVDKLGAAGELVRVKPGFARNYLLPRSLAVVATPGNVKQIEHERKLAVAAAAKLKGAAEGAASKLQGVRVEITAQAGEGDRLFGSVTSRDVADELKKLGIDIDRKDLHVDAVKSIGEFDVVAKLGAGVSTTFKLVVKRAG